MSYAQRQTRASRFGSILKNARAPKSGKPRVDASVSGDWGGAADAYIACITRVPYEWYIVFWSTLPTTCAATARWRDNTCGTHGKVMLAPEHTFQTTNIMHVCERNNISIANCSVFQIFVMSIVLCSDACRRVTPVTGGKIRRHIKPKANLQDCHIFIVIRCAHSSNRSAVQSRTLCYFAFVFFLKAHNGRILDAQFFEQEQCIDNGQDFGDWIVCCAVHLLCQRSESQVRRYATVCLKGRKSGEW